MKLLITPLAAFDLEEIGDYIVVDLKTGATLSQNCARAFPLRAVLNSRQIYTFTFPETQLHVDFS